jgi:MtN3 and saliva related transmembrane protein
VRWTFSSAGNFLGFETPRSLRPHSSRPWVPGYDMDGVTLIGLLAAAISTLGFAPQVIKIHRTRMTRDLSLGSYILLFAGLFLWLIYGLLLGALPIILGNAIACAMAAYIIYMKIRHG